MVAAAVIAIPTLVMLNQETQSPSSVPTSRPAPDTAPQVEAALPAEVPQDDPIDQLSETATTIDLADQDKPPILVGLQWHSKTTDYRNPAGSYDDVVYQIMSNQDGIVLINKNITSRPNSEVILSYDDSLNLIGGKTGRYIPALANYEFPLTQGKTWDVTSEVIGNAYKDLQQASGQVIGPETISTPLGDFDTIKVVVTHTTYLAGAEVSRGQDISWYSPKIGRAVRTEETSWDTETQSWVLGRVHEITSVTFP